MKSIEMNQALMEAINTTEVLGASALEETRALRQLIASANTRIEELETAAVEDAKVCATKGKFEHEGHHYTLDKDKVYDIIGDAKKYNTTEAANYRRKAKEQKALKDQSAVLTKDMRAIYEAYPINHPNIEPDSEKTTLKCLD